MNLQATYRDNPEMELDYSLVGVHAALAVEKGFAEVDFSHLVVEDLYLSVGTATQTLLVAGYGSTPRRAAQMLPSEEKTFLLVRR